MLKDRLHLACEGGNDPVEKNGIFHKAPERDLEGPAGSIGEVVNDYSDSLNRNFLEPLVSDGAFSLIS